MLVKTSATQVSEYRACARKWWWSYVIKLPRTQNASAELGTEVHEILEHYESTGDFTGRAEILPYVKPALELLPPPKTPGVMLEQRFEIPTYLGGPLWVGYIDLMWHSPPGHVTVIDHKTRSDFRYTLTSEQLQTDLQLSSYARAAAIEWPEADTFLVAHNYILTPRPHAKEQKKPRAKLISATLNRAQVDSLWESSLESVREMNKLYQLGVKTPIEQIPYNANECPKYGGCDFRKHCGFVEPADKFFSFIDKPKETSMSTPNGTNGVNKVLSIKEKIAAKKAALAGGGQPAPAAASTKATPAATQDLNPPDAPPDTHQSAQAAQEAAPASETPARRRGRPPKATTASQEAPEAQETPVQTASQPAAALTGRVILVNSLPYKGLQGAVLFDDWFAPIAAELAKEHKVPHFMLLDFGKQKAAVVDAVQRNLGSLPNLLVLYTRSPGASEALNAMTPHAQYIIHGA